LAGRSSLWAKNVELAVLGQELDLNALANLPPGLVDQVFLKLGQPSFGRADQVLHRRTALTHLDEDLFGWDAAVHHPNAPRLAVLRLDLGQEAPQRLVVAGVAGHDLAGERQAVRRHDERGHPLRAVRPLIPAVAVATLVALGLRRGVDFEVGAGQVVEQHVEAGVEQVAPAGDQMAEQLLLVGQQTVMTGVELVGFGQGEVRAQQIGQGALFEPVPVKLPLAPRRDQPVGRQHLQYMIPPRPFTAARQSFRPETIEFKGAPQLSGEPAGAPLARPAEPHLRETDLNRVGVPRRRLPVLGKQRQRSRFPGRPVDHFDGPPPGIDLRGIDLSQIKNLALDHSPTVEPLILDDVPVDVRLSVLLPLSRA